MNIQEVIIDTETTGLDLKHDRIIELAAIEVINGRRTSRVYHSYFNPYPVKVNESAFSIHGLSNEFLSNKPKFGESVQILLELLKDHILIAHNAKFDSTMINNELQRLGLQYINNSQWFDTLKMARQLFPGKPNSLGALCKRYKLKIDGRSHSALTDCESLLKIYELMCVEKIKNISKVSHN